MEAAREQSNVAITLPDGSVRSFARPVTAAEVARAIGPGLAKAALAARIDGQLADLKLPILRDAKVAIVTMKDDDALDLVRHDAAHVLAEAAKELYPDVQVTIGPVIENGFYYDFARKEPFTPEDLEKLEAKMREIVKRDEPVERDVWPREKAIAFFEGIGEHFKAEIVRDLPVDDEIRIYSQGKFVDLCRGPHLPSTGKLPLAFKLMKVAGAYWRGDSRNPMLQRVYGTAWRTEQELKEYLHRLEEAERRDHRRLGREMDLFHIQEEAVGAVFWHPKGWTLYRTLMEHVRRRIAADGYEEVNTPILVDRSLWEASGHWEKFRENMFTSKAEERDLALKPMNCPCHVQIFRHGIKSYRDLPVRMAEFGSCHRYEPSGALHGIMRVRAFVQDDAHIFCTEDQITAEAIKFCRLLQQIYRDFGFDDLIVKLADRPAKRAGEDHVWDKAEAKLAAAVEAADMPYTLNPGEGAFYGPKLEFHLKDAIGRTWQCGTLQFDFVLPERLDATYIGEDGKEHRPVMLHRAILGSLERFVGILIEHYAGRLPLWLAPVQAVVATITNDSDAYAAEVHKALKDAGIRAVLDASADKIGYKVREHTLAKVPLLIAVGKREAEGRSVSLRRLGTEVQEALALDQAVARLSSEAQAPT